MISCPLTPHLLILSFLEAHMKEDTFLPFPAPETLEVKGDCVLKDPFNWVGGLTQGIGYDRVSTPQPRASPVVPVSLEKDLHWKRPGPEACSSSGFTLQNLPSSNVHSFGPHCTRVSNRVTWAEKCQRIYYFTEGFKHQLLIV